MFVGAVSPSESAGAARMIGVAKTKAVDEELQRSDIVFGEKHDMVDGLGYCALTPFAMQIEPLDIAGRVDRVGLTHDGSLSPHSQAQWHAIVGEKVCRTVGIAAQLTIDRKTCNQFFQRFSRIDTP